ncbi:Box C/D snoRNA protein 1 [Podospora australis]|uniref:Box C/D snoRNA protein 1 n=1 Tax=Podospora australis TaxID=1536484 RepID=A0AAN6X1N8_9PEZI|nr:Box C/D snoRNA protein 1 [Podospora australis]
MSDSVLSTLCSICHVEPPKYKCPRCGARTCSVACIQKHKSRADCDGVRNPRAFIPATQLRTPAGLDHDFNFISAIERARRRNETEVIEVRQLLNDKEIHLPKELESKQFEKVWHGDELHHVPNQHGNRHSVQDGAASFDKNVRRRLRQHDIEVVNMPKGMSRQKENTTSWNRKRNTINWQVEWLLYGFPTFYPQQPETKQPLRILNKSIDTQPLYQNLAITLEWHRLQLDRQARKEGQQPLPEEDNIIEEDATSIERTTQKPNRYLKSHKKNQPPITQNFSEGTWPAAPYTFQHVLLSSWSLAQNTPTVPPAPEEELSQWRFFLQKSSREQPNTRTLIPLGNGDTSLSEELKGRTVLEFPTIFAFAPGEECPPKGYTIGPETRREPRPEREEGEAEEDNNGDGRKRRFGQISGRGRGNSRGGRSLQNGDWRGGKRGRVSRDQRAPNERRVEVDQGGASDEEGEVADGGEQDHRRFRVEEVDEGEVMDVDEGALPAAEPRAGGTGAVGGLGLVDYGSDSD